MKKQMIVMMMLVVVGLLLTSGCGQSNQIQREYQFKIQHTIQGYSVIITRPSCTFKDNIKIVMQDKQFRTHMIFWSTFYGTFYIIPFPNDFSYTSFEEVLGCLTM